MSPRRPPSKSQSFSASLRVIADGLVARAETLPRKSDAGRLLRDAATSLLDADTALERDAEEQTRGAA